MDMSRWTNVPMFIVTVTVAALLFCTDKPAGVDDNRYGGLYGKLVDGDGKPVSGAGVKAIATGDEGLNKAAHRAAALSSDTDSVFTDENGYYFFESLDAGTYNIQGNYDNGSLAVLITGITYDSTGAIQEIKTDTLRVPGRIAGKVNTATDDDGGVLCYIPGTSFLAVTDDSGAFIIANVPRGNYTIAYRKEQLKTVSDTEIEVRSGEQT
jgi:hypothetical protein